MKTVLKFELEYNTHIVEDANHIPKVGDFCVFDGERHRVAYVDHSFEGGDQTITLKCYMEHPY